MMSKPNHRSWVLTSLGAAAVGALVFACSSSGNNSSLNNYVAPVGSDGGGTPPVASIPGSDGGLGPGTQPFQAVAPAVYVAKVKNLMLGLAPTDEEVAQVTKDPSQLRTLVTAWTALPQFTGKMQEFFRNAFQQNQVTLNQLETNTNFPLDNWLNNGYQARFTQSLEDSFANTAQSIVKAGQPFNSTITTGTYMLTTAQLVLMAYMDELNVADNGQTTNRLVARNAILKFSIDPTSTATVEDTLNPSSPNFMVWHDPVAVPTGCTNPTPVVYDARPTDAGAVPNNNQGQNYNTLFQLIFGGAVDYQPCYPHDQYGNATTPQGRPILQDSDFTDYHMVTITPIAKTETTSPAFYEIPSLRTATSVNFHVPRVGFTGTLAFETNWGTNITNENRVTTNQTLIVAIDQSIDGENTVATFPVGSTDADHAANPACTGCHSQLDPIKEYFNHSDSLFYSDQIGVNGNLTGEQSLATQAAFGIDGVSATGQYIKDLMGTLSTHPRYALAWAQKLQFWATSEPAEETDPELIRIANVFAASNFNFNTLALEVFTSPLVTFASSTQTLADNGILNSISRRDHWCAALSNRLGVTDICGQISSAPTNAQQTVAARASLLAVDAYYRAYAIPSLATTPDLFFRATVEDICGVIAGEVIDDNTDAGPSRYSSTNPTAAITDMVNNVMGLPPSDPRAAAATTVLTNHLAAAKAVQASAQQALQSTFVLACTSPSSVLLGL